MSLKAFHLFFITLSIVLAAFTAAWATEQYRAAHDASYLAMAIGAALAGAGLAVYGTAFQRKARRFS
jgi:hypothetical protein